MKKVIIISAYPKWVHKILQGYKKAYVCKVKPTCELPITVYVYCTKRGHFEIGVDDVIRYLPGNNLKGKVVAKFTLNKVEEINLETDWNEEYERLTAMTREEALVYADQHETIAIWHIDNPVILVEPLLLNEAFYNVPTKKQLKENPHGVIVQSIMKAPQTYTYALTKE